LRTTTKLMVLVLVLYSYSSDDGAGYDVLVALTKRRRSESILYKYNVSGRLDISVELGFLVS